MPSTATMRMPFLCHTRTLAGRQSSKCLATRLSSSSSNPNGHDGTNSKFTETDAGENSSKSPAVEPSIRATQSIKNVQGTTHNTIRDIASEYSREGMKDGTWQPNHSRSIKDTYIDWVPIVPTKHDKPRLEGESKEETVEFEEDVDPQGPSIHRDQTSYPPRYPTRSTITDREQAVFQEIFADLFRRNPVGTAAEPLVESEQSGVNRGRFPGSGSARAGFPSMKDLMKKAIRKEFVGCDDLAFGRTDEAAVARFPPVLRAAAAKAISLDQKVEKETKAESSRYLSGTMSLHELEKIRQPERERVENLMRTAATDFKLWNVLEEEVFPLVTRLGLKLSESGPEPEATNNGPAKQHETSESTANVSKVAQSLPEGISALEYYGPLYPSYLLLAIRLLDTSFYRPSALTLNMLPKIKSLGIISHVLGASTPLYNALMRIYCFREDDLAMVWRLAREMQELGLYADEETELVVKDMATYKMAITSGDKGTNLKCLWQMPEWEVYQFDKLGGLIERMRTPRHVDRGKLREKWSLS